MTVLSKLKYELNGKEVGAGLTFKILLLLLQLLNLLFFSLPNSSKIFCWFVSNCLIFVKILFFIFIILLIRFDAKEYFFFSKSEFTKLIPVYISLIFGDIFFIFNLLWLIIFLTLLNSIKNSLWKILFDSSFSSDCCLRIFNSSEINVITFDFISINDSMNSIEIVTHSVTDEEFLILEIKLFEFILEKSLDINWLNIFLIIFY